MGSLTVRLAFSGIRARRMQSALTIVVVAAVATALTIGVGMQTIADRPFERTFAATNGAHVTVDSADGGPLEEVARRPSVVGSTDVMPVAWTAFDRAGKRYGLRLIGLGDEPPAVSTPLLVEGELPRAGEVALERSFATFHDLRPGSTLDTPGGPLPVSGIVVVSLGAPYPQSQPGDGFGPVSTLEAVVPDRADWTFSVGVRIAEPNAADAFAADAEGLLAGRGGSHTWLEDRAEATSSSQEVSVVISLLGALLLLAAGAVLGTLVGGRVVAQSRDIGTLKATGLTPGQVARVLVLEQLGLAVVGVAAGVVLGRLLTPAFSTTAASLLNVSETPPIDPAQILLVTAIALGAVVLFTFVPGLHAARRTTAAALAGGVSQSARRSRVGGLADGLGLPLPATVGMRGAFARRGRTILTVAALALTVTSAVATLGMEATLDFETNPGVAPAVPGLDTPEFDPVDAGADDAAIFRPVVYGLDALLLLVGLVNLLATLLLTTRERVRDLGVLGAIGMTPRQVTGSLVSEQMLAAALAGIVGLPLGLLFFRAAIELVDSSSEFAYPSWWALALLVPGLVALVALLATPIARRAASVKVSDAVRFE